MTIPIILLTVMTPIVGITFMAIGTIMRRPSGRGATKRTGLFPWKGCGKWRVNYRPAFTDAKAWFMPPKSRAAGSSSRLSESEWISQLGMNGMAENHGPGSSPSERMMEWMELRCMRFLTDAVIAPSHRKPAMSEGRLILRNRIDPLEASSAIDQGGSKMGFVPTLLK
ncbi:hypothetical protein ABIA27_003631 [Sinorhizobium fredii]